MKEIQLIQRNNMSKIIKLALEFAPLLVFFFLNNIKTTTTIAGYDLSPIFLATLGFIIATIISLIGTYILLKKLPVMPLVSGVFVLLFGGLTLYLHDETFIKIKPTLVNLLLGSVLLIGLRFNRIFLKTLLEEGINLTLLGWRGLTIRWGLFFYFLALLNEIIWRNLSTNDWATFKVFGVMPITILFVISQMRFIYNHMQVDVSELNQENK